MAKLPDSTALGENPVPVLPRRTPMISTYRPTSGFEEMPAQELAQSAGQLEQASHAALQAKIDQDNLRVEDLATQGKQAQYDLTYGKNGFALLKGGDAVNRPLVKEYGDKFDGSVAQLSGRLDNDFQRQLFQKRMQAAGLQMREDIVRHVARETDVYAEHAFKSGMDVDVKLAGARWDKPDSDATALLSMRNRIEGEARRQGLQGDIRDAWITEHTMAATSSVYAAMIKQALASDPVKGPFAAEALLKLHGTELDATARVVLTNEVQRAVLPLQYRAVAQDAIKAVVPQAIQAMQLGGPQAAEAAAEPKPTDYSYVTPAGDKVTGTAPSEAEALRRTRLGSGLPEYAPQKAATKIDTMALMGDAIANAREVWLKGHPGDTVGADHVMASVKEYFSTIGSSLLAEQRKNYGTVLAALRPAAAPGQAAVRPPTTQQELFANPDVRAAFDNLDSQQQFAIITHLHANASEANGDFRRSDPALYNSLRQRIYLPEGDPNKLTVDKIPQYAYGINFNDEKKLRDEIAFFNSPEGNPFLKQVNHVKTTAHKMLTGSMGELAIRYPDLAEEAAYRFGIDLDNKIKAAKSTPGKDVQDLFIPGTKEYVLDPNRVAAFMPSPSQIVAEKAGKPRVVTPAGGAGPAGPQRNPGESPADYLKRIGK